MDGAAALLKTWLWLVTVAFLIGFAGWLALARPTPAAAREEARQAPVSGPTSKEWNFPKHV